MEKHIQAIITGNPDEIEEVLDKFLQDVSQQFTFPELNRNNNRVLVWQSLLEILRKTKVSRLHLSCLSLMRILSREKVELNEIIKEEVITLMNYHACIIGDKRLDELDNLVVAVEALKAMCNIIYNSRVAAAICSKNGTMPGILQRLKHASEEKLHTDIKFFDMKILFLITALCSETRIKVKEEMHGLVYLTEALDNIARENLDASHNLDKNKIISKISEKDADFCCEILKVLFNLTLPLTTNENMDSEEEVSCLKLVSILRDLLLLPVEKEAKQYELHNHISNLLTNMPNRCLKALMKTKHDEEIEDEVYLRQDLKAVNELLLLLRWKLDSEPTIGQQHEVLSPVIGVLVKCANGDRILRKFLRKQILPPLRDVHHRPEQGKTLRNCLCRLLTTPITQVRDLAAELLFILCKENVGRMIKYTGYGNAAGMFANRGLLGAQYTTKYSSDSSDSETEEYNEYKHGINPVMGCYEEPYVSPTANMTEEQKEYEAMKLVNLMESMTRRGIVKPCKIGEDGRPVPIEHILQLQEDLPAQQIRRDSSSD